jgi:Zn-dependent protease with chaperone function
MGSTVEPTSIHRRALSVVLVLVGFYAIAFGIVATSIGLAIAFMHAGLIVIPFVTIGVFVAIVVIGSTIQTTTRLETPPDADPVTARDHPALFEVIDQVAVELSTKRPHDVYLVPDVDAAVAEDAVLLGLVVRRRILLIGVGLLEVLTVDELRAVIAHEFGHYAAADSRVATIAYRSRETMLRTLQILGENTDPVGRSPLEELVEAVFRRYAHFVIKRTAAISRAQEIEADRWASRIGGKGPAIRALERLEPAASAYELLVQHYIYPLARNRILPLDPIAALPHVMCHRNTGGHTAADDTNEGAPDMYDSHPPMRQRIAAIAEMPAHPHADDPRPARELLTDPAGTGRTVVDGMFIEGGTWRHVGWDEAGPELARALGDLGEEVLSLTNVPGDIGKSDLWELLEHKDLRTIRARISLDADLFQILPVEVDVTDFLTMRLRPYVAAAVIKTIGDDVDWSIDWSGSAGVRTPGHDIDETLNDLFAGGQAAVAARARLSHNS